VPQPEPERESEPDAEPRPEPEPARELLGAPPPPSGSSPSGSSVERPVPTTPDRNRRRIPDRRLVGAAAAAALVPVLVFLAVNLLNGDGTTGPGTSGAATSGPDATASGTAGATATATATSPVELKLPPILAHRGGWEVAPQQTVQAFAAAAGAGFGVETDVRWTSDQQPVLVHDEQGTQSVRCDRPVRISRLTLKQVRALCHPIGPDKRPSTTTRVATLQEAAGVIADHPDAQFLPEVKVEQTPAQVGGFLTALANAGITDRTVVTSQLPGELAKIREHAKQVGVDIRLMLFERTRKPVSQLTGRGLAAVAVPYDVATKAYVRQLHDEGLQVVTWTPNDVAGWTKSRQVKADSVLTARPSAFKTWSRS
jgi:glycerophosphoryl diester phosphodiesterase